MNRELVQAMTQAIELNQNESINHNDALNNLLSAIIAETTNPNPTLINPTETAQQINVTVKTLANWRSTGKYKLPYVRVGNRIFYRQSDINAWLDSRTQTSTIGGAA